MKTSTASSGLLFVLAVTLSLAGCASTGGRSWNTGAESQAVVERALATGRSLLGRAPDSRVTVAGRTFVLDCVGTISAAYWGAGIDLQRDFAKYPGNAVNRLYRSLQDWGALHWHKTPVPGDLIFWDHTWDVEGDAQYPDGHTHAGLVLSVAEDGTVEYLHESVTRGVVVAYLNLYNPSASLTKGGKVVNSPMYLGSNFGRPSNPALWTSGQLWSAFGDASVVVRVLQGG